MIQYLVLHNLAVLGERGEWCRRGNDSATDSMTFSWLNTEIQNAYRYMRQTIYEAENARATGGTECRIDDLFRFQEIESLGEAAIYRDYRKLNRLRSQFFALLYFRRYGDLPFFDEARYLSSEPADDEYRNPGRPLHSQPRLRGRRPLLHGAHPIRVHRPPDQARHEDPS